MEFDPFTFTDRLVSKAGRLSQSDKDAIVNGLAIAFFIFICLFWYFVY